MLITLKLRKTSITALQPGSLFSLSIPVPMSITALSRQILEAWKNWLFAYLKAFNRKNLV